MGNDPRLTWTTELAAVTGTVTGADAINMTLLIGSVTVYWTESDRDSLTATWSVALTATGLPA